MRILLLGGTTEASQLAALLSKSGMDAVFSYAGRTAAPVPQPLPTRVGGFGGVAGLVAYIRAKQITHLVDATHPFAAGMSGNAYAAAQETGVHLLRLERAAWVAGAGDNWTHVPDLEAAADALPDTPCTVFLAIGKQNLKTFAHAPQHHYLLRLVDAPEGDLPLPETTVILARGPFDVAGDTALMRDHGVTHIVCKNAGGAGAQAKLDAARTLALPVIMAQRPALPQVPSADTAQGVMTWLRHSADRGV